MYRNLLTITFMVLIISIVFFSCGEQRTPQELWNTAMQEHNEKQYEKSIETYNRLIRTYPQDSLAAQAAFTVGDIYNNNIRDYGKAVESYERVVKRFATKPEAPKAQFMIGYIYANTVKDFDKARDAYNLFLKVYPQHELVPAVQFELKNLGRELDEIPELKSITTNP